jgi:hypothetical protein
MRNLDRPLRIPAKQALGSTSRHHQIDQAGWDEHLLHVEELEESYRVAREERIARQIEERDAAREERRLKRLEEERENAEYRQWYKETYG